MFSLGPGACHRARTPQAPPPKGGGLAGAALVRNFGEMEKAAAEQNAAAPWPSCHMKAPQPPAPNAAPWAKSPLFPGPPLPPPATGARRVNAPVCAGSRPQNTISEQFVLGKGSPMRGVHGKSAFCLSFLNFLKTLYPLRGGGGLAFCRSKSWAFSFFMQKILAALPPGLHAHFVPAFIPQFFKKTENFLCFET